MHEDINARLLEIIYNDYASQPSDYFVLAINIVSHKMIAQEQCEAIVEEYYLNNFPPEAEDIIFECYSDYHYYLPSSLSKVISRMVFDLSSQTNIGGCLVENDYGSIGESQLDWDNEEILDDVFKYAMEKLNLTNNNLLDDKEFADAINVFLADKKSGHQKSKERLAKFLIK